MDIASIRREFPYFDHPGAPIYLDSAATTQKPRSVIERMVRFYTQECSNIHRGGYPLADTVTRAYEHARSTVASFIGAQPEQIAFTMNATDSLNQAVNIIARACFAPGKNAVTTAIEHHSAFLPLQNACKDKNTELRILPIREDGVPDLDALDGLIDENTVCAVLTLGANSTGWTLPWKRVLPKLRGCGANIILDAAQYIAHERLDVRELKCDFLCFSGHKLYGPTGIGVLYMSSKWAQNGLGRLGGGMVAEVTDERFVRILSARALEAGTPPIAQALGLEAAIEHLQSLDKEVVQSHEKALAVRLRRGLAVIPGIRVIGEETGLPIVSFVSETLHAIELNKLLAIRCFALREGRHCTYIFHERMGLSATVRASLGMYNAETEIDELLNAVEQIQGKWHGG